MNAPEKTLQPKKVFSEYEIGEPKYDGPLVTWDILDISLDTWILIKYDSITQNWSGCRSYLDAETDEFGTDVEVLEQAEVDEIITNCELVPLDKNIKIAL